MANPPSLAVFPGSFDPLTNGHLDMIGRSARLFDRLVVAVLVNPAKAPLFSLDERVAMIRASAAAFPNVEVESYVGLLAQYVRDRGASAVVRGIRTATELAEEQQMALMNRHLYAGFETVFLTPLAELTYISSRLVKEVAALGGSIDGLVPPPVAAEFKRRRYGKRTISV